ncbi:MAG: M23 family metallopeptidase [Novosphingobium sp.]
MPTLVIPVDGVQRHQLVDTFTEARANGARRHDAIDILAPLGTPVRAAAPGFIEKLFQSREGGNTIYLRSADRRVLYYYAHLDRYAAGLAERQSVAAGQVIGTVGYSGNANPAAPHLHFAINVTTPEARWWDKALAVNPYPLLMRR